MKMPRIFMIGWEFPPYNSGGLGVACEGLTSALSANCVEQIFVLPKQLPINSSFLEVTSPFDHYLKKVYVNLPIFPYGAMTRDQKLYLQKRGINGVNDMVDEAYYYGQMVKEIAIDYDYDLIHGHDWMTYPAAMMSQKITGKPMILHVHSTEFDRTLDGKTNQRIADIEYEGLQVADKIITVSDYTKGVICDKYAVDSRKVEVVHNGVDLSAQRRYEISDNELAQFASNRKIVTFMGRVTVQKGPDYFIQIADKIARQVPDVLFVLGGDGDMQQSVMMMSASHRLTGKLLFAGFLRGRQKEYIYRRSDLFIMPSVSEPFGIVALEAASSGKPILISKQSGVKEVMPFAYTADFWDTQAFADEAVRLLNNYNYRIEMGELNARSAEEVTWSKAGAKCLRVYQEVINNQ